MKRQALYSCMTCKQNDEHAGVCFACSIHCHDGHDVVELYTKRHFRCDCGNSKFKSACALEEVGRFIAVLTVDENYKNFCHYIIR